MAPKCLGIVPAKPNHFVAAVIGLPNAGKTSTVNALTGLLLPTSITPLQTIEASLHTVAVPNPRCDLLAAKLGGPPAPPTMMTFIDTVAMNNSDVEGEDVNMESWSQLQQADVLFHVCRAFEADEVAHMEGAVDPIRDLEALQSELVVADLSYVKSQVVKRQRHPKGDYALEVFEKALICLELGTPLRHASWTGREEAVLVPHSLLTSKPMAYFINLTERDFVRQKNKWLARIHRWVQTHDALAPIVPYCATLEETLQSLSSFERASYMEELGAKNSMLEKMVEAAHLATGSTRFYTTMNGVPISWDVPAGTRAPQAAGVVRSDLQNAFQGVDVVTFSDYCSEDPEVRNGGKLHHKGKDYVVNEGDILHFKTQAKGMKSPVHKASTPKNKLLSPSTVAGSSPNSTIPGSPAGSALDSRDGGSFFLLPPNCADAVPADDAEAFPSLA